VDFTHLCAAILDWSRHCVGSGPQVPGALCGSTSALKAGDAQAMPFADNSFDIIINVESSLN
jgi:hypothetical protein